MIVKINKNLPYQILLGLCCAVPYLSNYELTFALWTFTIFITLKKSYSIRFLNYTACFLAIFLVALLVTDFQKSETYFIIRDVTYLLKPVLGLLLGYQICRFIYKNAIETIIYAGLGISIIHILVIVKTFFIFHHISVALLRDHCGFFSDFEVYALIFVLFHRQFQVDFTKKRFGFLVVVIGFSAFMYLSRTNFIQFVVLYLGMKGYFIFNRRAIIAIVSVIIGTILLYSAVLMVNPRRNGSSFEEFLYKIKVAPTEPFKSKVNANDYKDFNLNYRSLESIYTIKQVQGTKHVLIGSGLGSQIDLKQEVFLGDMKLRYISVLHNGFMTTYLKSGIVGVLILVFSIFLLSRQKKTQIPINRQFNFLMVGTSIFLLVSYWVLMGYYFTQDSKSILVGLMFAYTEITARHYAKDKVSGESA
jgi:hypothetical protein